MPLKPSTWSRRWFYRLFVCGVFAFPCIANSQSYYGANYQPKRTKPFATGAAAGAPAKFLNPTRDLYNQYFYHRPSVSPYLNLNRPAVGGHTTAYHTYVRGEQQRRERQAQQQSALVATRKSQTGIGYGAVGRVGPGSAAKPRPNAYYQQWYGTR